MVFKFVNGKLTRTTSPNSKFVVGCIILVVPYLLERSPCSPRKIPAHMAFTIFLAQKINKIFNLCQALWRQMLQFLGNLLNPVIYRSLLSVQLLSGSQYRTSDTKTPSIGLGVFDWHGLHQSLRPLPAAIRRRSAFSLIKPSASF